MSKNTEGNFKLYSTYIKQQIRESGLTYPIIENKLNWKPQTLNQMLNQDRLIKASDLKKLADLLNENASYLVDPDTEASYYDLVELNNPVESASGDSQDDILKRVKMIEDAVSLFDVADYCIISTDKKEIELLKQLHERISIN